MTLKGKRKVLKMINRDTMNSVFKDDKEASSLLKNWDDLEIKENENKSLEKIVFISVISFMTFMGIAISSFIVGASVVWGVVFSVLSSALLLFSIFIIVKGFKKENFVIQGKNSIPDQINEIYATKVKKDLKKFYSAEIVSGTPKIFYGSGNSRVEIKFDNGKGYDAKVYYRNEDELVVELIQEKHYAQPNIVLPNRIKDKNKNFNIIEDLKNIAEEKIGE